jgi:hypothetical protein
VLEASKEASLPALTGYADSNFIANGHSNTGFVLCLYCQPIYWCSKHETVLPGSSTEAQIMAINSGALNFN